MATTPSGGEDTRVSILKMVVMNLAGAGVSALASTVLTALRQRAARGRRHQQRGHGRPQQSETPFVDPRTGDRLTRGEHWAWVAQRIMRRWSFLGLITLATVVCWVWGSHAPAALVWWNLAASYAALVIESLTAMALINQTIRDAVVNRQTRQIVHEEMREVKALVEELHAKRERTTQQRHTVRGPDGRWAKVKAAAEEGVQRG